MTLFGLKIQKQMQEEYGLKFNRKCTLMKIGATTQQLPFFSNIC